jgi:hypothetical protein
MSLLDQSSSLYEIKLYYKFLSVEGNKKLVVIDDEKAKKILEDENKKKEIEVLETKWSNLTWKEQNEVSQLATRSTGPTGQKEFSFVVYRDAIVKRCLKSWNITVNDKTIPVTPEAIDALPGDVVARLYQKFEKILDYTEEDLGN